MGPAEEPPLREMPAKAMDFIRTFFLFRDQEPPTDPPLDDTSSRIQETKLWPKEFEMQVCSLALRGVRLFQTRITRQFYFWSPQTFFSFERPTCQAHLNEACSHFFFCLPLNISGILATLASAFLPACFSFLPSCLDRNWGMNHRVGSPSHQRMTRSHALSNSQMDWRW